MQGIADVGTILKLSLAVAIFIMGINMQHANASNDNGDGINSCNDHYHDSGFSDCSNKDTTPFILPFP